MFIWDFLLGDVMDQVIDWIYGQIVGFLGNFFGEMGNMGIELFSMPWVQSIILFFSYFGWALFGTGFAVSFAECGIEYQSGRGGSLKDAAMNTIKGFFAVNLFTVIPVELFKLSVSLQQSLTQGLTGYGTTLGELASSIIANYNPGDVPIAEAAPMLVSTGLGVVTSPLLLLFIIVMMGYAVIKIFFSNLKRGGILLIQIAVGSLYMFSIPRGYIDGFVQWMKQIIGLCLTSFLQVTILTAGLMVIPEQCILGLGLMLSAGEVPRIAGAFGLDTTTRANIMSAAYTAQAAVNTTRSIVQTIKK